MEKDRTNKIKSSTHIQWFRISDSRMLIVIESSRSLSVQYDRTKSIWMCAHSVEQLLALYRR